MALEHFTNYARSRKKEAENTINEILKMSNITREIYNDAIAKLKNHAMVGVENVKSLEMNGVFTMNEIIISNLSEELMEETVKFISSCQSVDESFVGWLGYSPEEIKSQLMDLTTSFKERCLIAVDRGVVCGFLGVYVSEEQSSLRLLGPYVSKQKSWSEIAANLLSALKKKIPAHIKMAKVAFYEANVNCKRVYKIGRASCRERV